MVAIYSPGDALRQHLQCCGDRARQARKAFELKGRLAGHCVLALGTQVVIRSREHEHESTRCGAFRNHQPQLSVHNLRMSRRQSNRNVHICKEHATCHARWRSSLCSKQAVLHRWATAVTSEVTWSSSYKVVVLAGCFSTRQGRGQYWTQMFPVVFFLGWRAPNDLEDRRVLDQKSWPRWL